MLMTHLNIEGVAHSVHPDSMETSVCQVPGSWAEHIWTPVCLQVIPDLQTPWLHVEHLSQTTSLSVMHNSSRQLLKLAA